MVLERVVRRRSSRQIEPTTGAASAERCRLRLNGKHYVTEEPVAFEIADGRVKRVGPTNEETDLWLAPALVDLQINGFSGQSFGGRGAAAEALRHVVQAQWRHGVGGLCPTVTTDAPERMVESIRLLGRASEDAEIAKSVLGIHVEGPFISPLDGPRGAHPLEHVRSPDWDEFCRWQEAADGRVRLVTLAPELDGAIALIERLTDGGVVVALGHTNASGPVIDAAIRAGARLSTHLGNGAHAFVPRFANYIWEQLARDELMASVIADGHHLPGTVLKCLVRAKGPERTILVSDAVHLAGMPPGRYEFCDQQVELDSRGRISLVREPAYLAGASHDLGYGVINAVRCAGLSLGAAVRMASRNPLRLLGLEREWGDLEPGDRADVMQFRVGPRGLEVMRAVVAGELVYDGSRG